DVRPARRGSRRGVAGGVRPARRRGAPRPALAARPAPAAARRAGAAGPGGHLRPGPGRDRPGRPGRRRHPGRERHPGGAVVAGVRGRPGAGRHRPAGGAHAAPGRRRGHRRVRRGPARAAPGARRGRVRRRGPRAARRLPAGGRLPGRGRARGDPPRRRRVPVAAHAGRDRPAPDLRGPARAAVGGARRARPLVRDPARHGGRDLVRGVGAERPRRAGDRGLRLLAAPGVPDALAGLQRRLGDLRAGRGAGREVQVLHPRAGRPVAGQGRPDGLRHRAHPGHGVGGAGLHARLAGRRVAGPAGGDPLARRPDEHLRAAPGVLAQGPGLPGRRRPARRLPDRDRLHPRGADGGGRAPVRRVLGLPGHLVLRPDRALRHPGRLPLLRRPAARRRHRRDHGLGPGALPEGRLGAGPVRRRPALRARRPAPRRAAGLGHAGVRLRPPRGAELPGRERALLAGGVPRRRAAGGRRRLDALPGLLPAGGAVAAQPVRRPGEPGRGDVPAGDERDGLPAGAGRGHHRRGVDRLAGRHPADPPRRPRLRLQVEHGLDARHPGLRRPGAGPPPVPPPPDDVLADVRLHRELHPALLPRRGRPREEVAAGQAARRPLAAGGRAAGAAGVPVGAPGQAAAVHGQRVRPGRRVGRREVAGLVAAGGPAAPRPAEADRRPQPGLPGLPRALHAGHLAGRVLLDRRERRRQQHLLLPALGGRGLGARLRGELRRRAARGLPAGAAAHRPVGGAGQHRLHRLRRLRRGQPRLGGRGGGAVARAAGVGHAPRTAAGRAVAEVHRRAAL
ncbi:MAG: GH13_9 / GH13_8 / GH13 / GH13_10 / CBM 48 / GH13_36, partial [uncultured Corynebacteriales bacterium]